MFFMEPLKIENFFDGFNIQFSLQLFGFDFSFNLFFRLLESFLPTHLKAYLGSFTKKNNWAVEYLCYLSPFFITDALAH
jgi:hypothetical protein